MAMKFEKDIFSHLNTFRQNPKSIQHQIEVLRKGISRLKPNDPFLKEIDSFVSTIDKIQKMSPLNLNHTLSQIAREEAKKYSRNESTYNPYLSGTQLKEIVPPEYLSQNPGLIADSGADEAETVVAKLLLNRSDKDKKGRKMLCSPEYSQVGIANTEFAGENYYVIIFANKDAAKQPQPSGGSEKRIASYEPNKNGGNEKVIISSGNGIEDIKEAFELFDVNDGRINAREIKSAMQNIGYDEQNPNVYEVMTELDNPRNKNAGGATFNDFCQTVNNRVPERETIEDLRRVFNLFLDSPNSKTTTLESIKKVADEIGENIDELELGAMLNKASKSGPNLTFEDFIAIMRNGQN